MAMTHAHEQRAAFGQFRRLVWRWPCLWCLQYLSFVVKDEHVFWPHPFLLHSRRGHDDSVAAFYAEASPGATDVALIVEISANFAY